MSILSDFIGTERNQYTTNGGNLFARSLGEVSRYYEYLLIIFSRYEKTSKKFISTVNKSSKLSFELTSSNISGPTTVTEEQIRLMGEENRLTNLVYLKGLVSASGGNISYKIKENLFLISPTNIALGRINYKDFVKINGDLEILSGNAKPSKEVLMHMAVYERRNRVSCVMHTHPIFATSFTVRNEKIPMVTVTAELKIIDTPIVEYANPGSFELKEMVKNKLKETDDNITNLILRCHGILTFGERIEQAFNTTELIEDTAKIAFYSSMLSNFIE